MKSKLLVLSFLFSGLAFAQTYTFSTLVNFPNSSKQSAVNPWPPVVDAAGNIYGSSFYGGKFNSGSIFKVTPSGALSVLYSFGSTPNDGGLPQGALIRDAAGNLYGEAYEGGAKGFGIIFKVSPTGKETILYSFTDESAVSAIPSLARDSSGNLYGYNAAANNENGSVFKLAPNGTYTTLYTFCSLANCADGQKPVGGPIMKPDGKLYGVTAGGGTGTCPPVTSCGIVFQLDLNGNETVLHDFSAGGDGFVPSAHLTQDSAGNLYGVTAGGGLFLSGTIFKVDPSGRESIVYNFCPQINCPDGGGPSALLRDAAGDFFGISLSAVFELTSSGTETVLHPSGPGGLGYGLAIDSKGNLYGTTWDGGPAHAGSVYKLTKH